MMNINDMHSVVASLYDGGWRAEDRDQMIAEYDFTPDEADAVCAGLAEMDEQDEDDEEDEE